MHDANSYSVQLIEAPGDRDDSARAISHHFRMDFDRVRRAIEYLPATLFHGLSEGEFERVKDGLVELSRSGMSFRRCRATSVRLGAAAALPARMRDGVDMEEEPQLDESDGASSGEAAAEDDAASEDDSDEEPEAGGGIRTPLALNDTVEMRVDDFLKLREARRETKKDDLPTLTPRNPRPGATSPTRRREASAPVEDVPTLKPLAPKRSGTTTKGTGKDKSSGTGRVGPSGAGTVRPTEHYSVEAIRRAAASPDRESPTEAAPPVLQPVRSPGADQSTEKSAEKRLEQGTRNEDVPVLRPVDSSKPVASTAAGDPPVLSPAQPSGGEGQAGKSQTASQDAPPVLQPVKTPDSVEAKADVPVLEPAVPAQKGQDTESGGIPVLEPAKAPPSATPAATAAASAASKDEPPVLTPSGAAPGQKKPPVLQPVRTAPPVAKEKPAVPEERPAAPEERPRATSAPPVLQPVEPPAKPPVLQPVAIPAEPPVLEPVSAPPAAPTLEERHGFSVSLPALDAEQRAKLQEVVGEMSGHDPEGLQALAAGQGGELLVSDDPDVAAAALRRLAAAGLPATVSRLHPHGG